MDTAGTGAAPLVAVAFALMLDATGHVLLVRHNYGGSFYALPGGAVEPGETPQAAVEREIREELCVDARATRLLSITSYGGSRRFVAYAFLAEISAGEPALPGTDEIAEVGWFDPEQLPQPVYPTVDAAVRDARRGDYGVLRAILLDD